jgi:5'-3' exonuclease
MDADLMFLACLNSQDHRNLYLVRENIEFRQRGATPFANANKYPYVYLSIGELTELIINTLDPRIGVRELQAQGFNTDLIDPSELERLNEPANSSWFTGTPAQRHNLLVDYSYLCFFLGNDFVPSLPSYKIRHGAFNELIVLYKKLLWHERKCWLAPNQDGRYRPDPYFQSEFLAELAHIEDELLLDQTHKRQRDIAQAHQRHHPNRYEAELEAARYVEDRYVDTILGGTPGWRQRYYEQVFRLSAQPETTAAISRICQAYLEGTYWIIDYYTLGASNWSYIYPYPAAPTAHDLSEYWTVHKIEPVFPVDAPVSPYVQLMSILPAESAALLPPVLADYLTHRNSPVHYLYPVTFQVSYYGNKWLHECRALLPHINRELLDQLVRAHEPDYTPAERRRNQTGELVVI